MPGFKSVKIPLKLFLDVVSSPPANNVTRVLRDVKVKVHLKALGLSTCCLRAVHVSKICVKRLASRLDLPGSSETWDDLQIS